MNLGNAYGAVGRLQDAVSSDEESVKVFRPLAAGNPAHLSDLAKALNNLGSRLAEMGRHADAVGHLVEAARIFRRLAADNPVYQQSLVLALSNLARSQQRVGDQPTKKRFWRRG